MINIQTVNDEDTKDIQCSYQVPTLPLDIDLEDKEVLKRAGKALSALSELKGVAGQMPNPDILIDTLSLQEAKDSSEIENIITTSDELYQSDIDRQYFASTAAKEVSLYAVALRDAYQKVKETGIISNKDIKKIQATIEGNEAGFRTQSGTTIKNQQTGEIIHTPPQTIAEIQTSMKNLENFINNDDISDWDDLVKMAVIHHQFESIHPFFDGNGRTGRILNIIYLVKQGLLDSPILYLSRYINQNKVEYYRLLQIVRNENAWKEWVLFILDGLLETSKQSIELIKKIKLLMQKQKNIIRTQKSKIYSQDLINNLFKYPYTKISFLEKDLSIHSNTAAKYLNELVEIGILEKHKIGKENFYLNIDLFDLLHNVGEHSVE